MPQQQMTEEQAKALQEKLKNMSPEELKEFQKKQCIFCQIISGKVASKKIYEDDLCFAILDINPANPGHVLLMLKEHYQIMPMIPDEELAHISMVSKALSHAMLKALKAQGTNIFIANGIAAGQRAQHFMLHIIPRKEGDNLPLDIPQKDITQKELIEIKKAVQERIFDIFKIKKTSVEFKPEEELEKEVEELETIEGKPSKPKKSKISKTIEGKPSKPLKSKISEAKKEKEPEDKSKKMPAKEKPASKKKASKQKKPAKKKSEEEEEPEQEGGIGLDDIARLLK